MGPLFQVILLKLNENVTAENVEIKPDPRFCLKDANIALVTSDNWAFCVHQSVLQRLSVVYQNLFEDSSPPKSPKERPRFNGLDVVKVSESHDVMRTFFSIIYDQK